MNEMIDYLKKEASEWPGATVAYRESWECDYFQVAQKGFCLLGKNKANQRVMTVKGRPEINEQLKEQYAFIVPGYYSNKTHWISVILEESDLSVTELIHLLQTSYQLVFEQLPKKTQAAILDLA